MFVFLTVMVPDNVLFLFEVKQPNLLTIISNQMIFQIDEVMSELSGGGGDDDDRKNGFRHEHAEESKKGSDLKDLKDLVR